MRALAFRFWALVVLIAVTPLILATQSPLLQWRDPIYIGAGFAGIFALGLLFLKPLLKLKSLPGLHPRTALRLNRLVGIFLVLAVLAHVAGLWITSPPDMIDALTFTSPTPFTPPGVIAMWAIFLTAALVAMRKRFPPKMWRVLHLGLGVIIILGSVAHAVLIEGTMEPISKWILAIATVGAGMALILRR